MATNPFPNPFPASTPQLTYQNNFNQPRPGSIADDAEVQDFVTGIAPAAYTLFGCLVVNDPAVTATIGGGIGQGIKHPVSGAEVTAGIVGFPVRTAAMETRRDTFPPSYEPGNVVNVQRAGRQWTMSEVAVVKHDPVYVRVTANGALNTLGALRNDADGGNAVLVPNAKWMDGALEAVPVRVEFNFIGQ